MGKQWKIEIKKLDQDTLHSENAMFRELYEKHKITTSFAESLFPEWMTFTHATWVKSVKLKLRKFYF